MAKTEYEKCIACGKEMTPDDEDVLRCQNQECELFGSNETLFSYANLNEAEEIEELEDLYNDDDEALI